VPKVSLLATKLWQRIRLTHHKRPKFDHMCIINEKEFVREQLELSFDEYITTSPSRHY
jgi:hypothetical protein